MAKVSRNLRTVLSDSEKEALAKEITDLVLMEEAIETKKRIVTADLTSELKNTKKAKREKARQLHDGFCDKLVDCEEVANFETNRVIVKRIDSGVIIDERAMREDERQTAIKFPDGKPSNDAPVVPIGAGKKKRLKPSDAEDKDTNPETH